MPYPLIWLACCHYIAAIRLRRFLGLTLFAAAIGGFFTPVPAANICWSNGVTPGGHFYRVLYVPPQAVTIAASGQMHNYIAVAVALVPGWIWADRNIPCAVIPWEHEEMHLDGWVHDADGRWVGRRNVPDDRSLAPWYVVKRGDEARLGPRIGLAACEEPEPLPAGNGNAFFLFRGCDGRNGNARLVASALER
jgi:hypothetical protein